MTTEPQTDGLKAWGEIFRQGATRAVTRNQKRASLFWNHWTTADEIPCCLNVTIAVHSPETPTGEKIRYRVIWGDGSTSLKFSIDGGSDAPHFKLTLSHKPSGQRATLCFMAWTSEQPPNADPRPVNRYPNVPVNVPHTFSAHLINVTWQRTNQYPDVINTNKPWPTTETTKPLMIEWEFNTMPIGINLDVDTSGMSPEATAMFDTFRSIQKREARAVSVATRVVKGMEESWAFFAAQPSPTPHSWWRYTEKTEADQNIMDTLPNLDEESVLGRYHLARKEDLTTARPPRICQTIPIDVYLDARQYEVFTVGALIREINASKEINESTFNKEYSYDLMTVQELAHKLAARNTFLIMLQVGRTPFEGTKPVFVNQPAPQRALGSLSSNPIPEITGESQAPPVPGVNTELVIESKSEQFNGRVISVDGNLLTMEVHRTRGTGDIVLLNRSGFFRFSDSGFKSVVAKKAIQAAMWRQPPDNWLKTLLLGHKNRSIVQSNPGLITPAWTTRLPAMNTDQRMAFMRVVQISRSLADTVTLVQGPPGTGKTFLIAHCIQHCLQRRMPWLNVAPTPNAVRVCADKIFENLQLVGENPHGIWIFKREGVDSLEEFADSESEILTDAPNKIIQALNSHAKPASFSLTSYIASRLQLHLKGRPLPADEMSILRGLNSAKTNLERFNQIRAEDEDDLKSYVESFDKKWQVTQAFYITTQARGVITTAPNSLARALRDFKPHQIIIDDASDLTEYASVATISTFFEDLQKLVLVGNSYQKAFFTRTHEFEKTAVTSLLTRLINSGVPVSRLVQQHRMHPHIAELIPTFFSDITLTNAPSVLSRPEDRTWHTFHAQNLSACGKRHSIFVHIKNSVLYYFKERRSMVNPSHLVIVRALVNRLRAAGATKIAVLTPYKAQQRLMGSWQTTDVNIATIDSAQGQEYNFVIVDLVNPSGRRYPLGFLTDLGRMFAGLSKAKIGLLIIGNKNMADVPWPSEATKVWGRLIEDHVRHNAVCEKQPGVGLVRTLMREHDIPGDLYEKVAEREG